MKCKVKKDNNYRISDPTSAGEFVRNLLLLKDNEVPEKLRRAYFQYGANRNQLIPQDLFNSTPEF